MMDALTVLGGTVPPGLGVAFVLYRMLSGLPEAVRDLKGSVDRLNESVTDLKTSVAVLQKTVELENRGGR